MLLTAARLFDAQRMQADIAVRVADGTIAAIGPADSIQTDGARRIDLGDGTILPGFIDLHVHIGAQNIPFDRVLTHGVTTVRDLGGGPLPSTAGGPGILRYVAAGGWRSARNRTSGERVTVHWLRVDLLGLLNQLRS